MAYPKARSLVEWNGRKARSFVRLVGWMTPGLEVQREERRWHKGGPDRRILCLLLYSALFILGRTDLAGLTWLPCPLTTWDGTRPPGKSGGVVGNSERQVGKRVWPIERAVGRRFDEWERRY
ncbi:unnamed protein product [Calypogeia fissa]